MPLESLDRFLTPISPQEPCGANLESDPAFSEFGTATQGKPERQIGKTIQPAEDPDWKVVTRSGVELLGRSKDLRVCVQLVRALLHTDGLAGLAQGLMLTSGIVQTYWEGLHPRLDPSDGNDPMMRLNILATLTAPEMISAVRATPLVSSRRVGRFSLKAVDAAQGNGTADPNLEAAVMDCDVGELQADTAAAGNALAAVQSLDAALAKIAGAGSWSDSDQLLAVLQKIAAFLQAAVARRAPVSVAATEGADGKAAPVVAPPSGEIASREDVLRALDRISGYYKKHEPSSPIPLFIERCKRLVTMSFLDIVRDLVPDAVKQVEVLKGKGE